VGAPDSVGDSSARLWLRAKLGRARGLLAGESHHAVARRSAGAAFLIRFASAAFVYLSQVLLARWMGRSEFGLYVYVWTWVLLVGDLIHLGLASAAQRFIPAYTQEKAFALLRGFLVGSRWLVFGFASAAGLVLAAGVRVAQIWLPGDEAFALYLACATLPAYALANMLDGTARSYDWIGLALLPPYMLRPLLLLVLMAAAYLAGVAVDAALAMMAAVVACWAATILQIVLLDRRLKRAVPPGPRVYAVGAWMRTALPILMVWGFYTLLTYTDVLVLSQFAPNAEVALYYAAAKTLALVAFVYFSVGAAVAHRFSEYHAAGERERLADFVASAVRWTFWPSLAALAVVLALGRPFLALYGHSFVAAYPLMFILAVGLLARASVGPAERLLNMLGEQRPCAAVYAIAFIINLVLSLALAPRHGAAGVAIATATAVVSESVMLFAVAKWRLGLHVFVWRPRAAARTKVPVHV
jgi:O-antigen/teichoic acid export membrane protein